MTLNLESKQLSVLPPGVFAGLTALETLTLANNAFSTLPAGIFAGLTALEVLFLSGSRLATLPPGIFADLTALTNLSLINNQLDTLPAGVFAGLTALRSLSLGGNDLATLPPGIFAGLSRVSLLDLSRNVLTTLPADIFNGLAALQSLYLEGNRFTSGTGLPVGIFDDVLDTLGILGSFFRVDNTVRNAHFVCSRPDFADIVDATAGVRDCLRVSAAQFYAYLVQNGATLSNLTLSVGALTPVFAADVADYTVTVPSDVTAVAVIPTANRDGATITVNTAPVLSGSPSEAIALPPPGSMAVPITIEVTNADITATYRLMATRIVPPGITGIELTSNAGDDNVYTIGDAIEATVTFSTAVTVTGMPRLALTVGTQTRQAVYTRGSTTPELVFSYPVVAGDRDDDGVAVAQDALTTNSGTIRDVAGNDARLAHTAIAANSAHRVDTAVPTVGAVSINGNRLTLAYNEALADRPVPAPTAWTLTLGSGARAPAVRAGGVTIGGTTVTLTLDAAVELPAVVTLDYTAAANPVRDLAGNHAAGFQRGWCKTTRHRLPR